MNEKLKAILKDAHTGPNNARWKGDNVSYYGLHTWVYRQLGKPKTCEMCGQEGRFMEWANRSGEYRRDVSDWIRLCKSCHTKYDASRGQSVRKDYVPKTARYGG